MAVIEYDSYKQKLLAMDETFENLFKALEIRQARQGAEPPRARGARGQLLERSGALAEKPDALKQLQNKIHRLPGSFPRATICSR